jgi:outer membrane lipoprotein-sorting protein
VKRAYFILALAASLVRAESVDQVLRRMDQAAQNFKSLAANVRQTDYHDLFQEKTVEDGEFRMMKRSKNGVVLLAKFKGQDERKVRISDNRLEIYHPKANSEDIYDTRKLTKSMDSFLLVGFGVSSKELLDAYQITIGGTEVLDGVNTTRLDLAPKSAEKQNLFKMIQLWIPQDKGNPIQERVLLGKESKDYHLLQFSDLKINPAIPASEFELNLPAGVKQIRP